MLPQNLVGLVRGAHKARAKQSDNVMRCGPLSPLPPPLVLYGLPPQGRLHYVGHLIDISSLRLGGDQDRLGGTLNLRTRLN